MPHFEDKLRRQRRLEEKRKHDRFTRAARARRYIKERSAKSMLRLSISYGADRGLE